MLLINLKGMKKKTIITVNWEIFVRVLFSRNFAYMQKFVKTKSSRNGVITLSFIDIG